MGKLIFYNDVQCMYHLLTCQLGWWRRRCYNRSVWGNQSAMTPAPGLWGCVWVCGVWVGVGVCEVWWGCVWVWWGCVRVCVVWGSWWAMTPAPGLWGCDVWGGVWVWWGCVWCEGWWKDSGKLKIYCNHYSHRENWLIHQSNFIQGTKFQRPCNKM